MSAWATMLDRLVRERGAALFGYAYVLTGDRDSAEDLVQDALVRTFRSGRSSGSVDQAHAYVKRCIATAFIDGGRRAKARPRRDAMDVNERPGVAVTPDRAAAVDAALDVQRALLTLPPRERACVVLRHLEDLPVARIAGELGLSEGSVKRYLHGGIARLREAAPHVDFTERETVSVDRRTPGGAS